MRRRGGRSRRGGPRGRAITPGPTPATHDAEVRIDGIAAGGAGVGRSGGLVVFTPRTAPGDLAEVRVAPAGRFAHGVLLALREPSSARAEPPCPHYVRDRCGGCQIQHLTEAAQLEAKRRLVADALARIGHRSGIEVPPVVPSPGAWRYRRKLTLALRRSHGRWTAGLHAYDDPDTVFALADCPITDERVLAVWHEVLAAAEWLPADAPALRAAVRLLDEGSGAGRPGLPHSAAFVLEGARHWGAAERFFAAVPSVAALWWAPEGRSPRLLHDRRAHAEPGAAFVQVNPGVASLIADHLVARALAHGPATLVDAYAGAGDVAVRLAGYGVRVTAIELDGEAARWAAERLPDGSRSWTGRVEDRLGDALPADVVVVNPPRAGLHERVPATLEGAAAGAFGSPPRALLYVSCNPATLARDLARLPSWQVHRVQPFDMFPQTAHVETVVELLPVAGPLPFIANRHAPAENSG